MKRRLTLIGSVLFGIGLLAGLILYFGPEEIWHEIRQLGWTGFAVLAATITGSIVCWTAAWQILLRAYGIRISSWLLWKARLSGFSLSYLTPSAFVGGEPVSVYLVTKEGGVPATRVLATVMVSKLLEGVSLLTFIVLGSGYALLAHLGGQQIWALLSGIVVFLIFLVGGAINFIGRRLWLTRLIAWCKDRFKWKSSLSYLESKARTVEEDTHSAFQTHRQATFVAFMLTNLATLLMFLRPQVFFYFADHKVFSFSQLAIVFALIVVVSAILWITPGGLGVFEGGMIGILALLGISQHDAIAYGLALKIVELPLVGLGLFHLMRFGLVRLVRENKWPSLEELRELEASAEGGESADQRAQQQAQAEQSPR